MTQIEIDLKAVYDKVAKVSQIKVIPITEATYRANIYSTYRPEGGAWDVSYMVGSHFVKVKNGSFHYDPPLGEHYRVK
jgi:hypothetical protein